MTDTFLQYALYITISAALWVLSAICVTMMVLMVRSVEGDDK